MSHTFYDSPDDADSPISIDVTHDYVWFFQDGHDEDNGYARVRKSELPAIYKAMGVYLGVAEP